MTDQPQDNQPQPQGGVGAAAGATTQPNQPPQPGSTDQGAAPPAPWRGTWPEEYQKDPLFRNFDSPEQLLKSYKHNASMIGADKNDIIRKPKSADDKDGWEAYHRATGRPDTPDAYTMPKGMEKSSEAFKEMAAAIHKVGGSNEVFQSVLGFLSQQSKAIEAEESKAWEEKALKNAEQLRSAWGAAFDTKSAETKALINTLPAEDKKMLEDVGALNSATFLDWLSSKVAPGLREDGAHGGGNQATGGNLLNGRPLSPQEATVEWNRKQADPDFTKRLIAGDKLALEEQTRLFGFMHPAKK